jgi:transposase
MAEHHLPVVLLPPKSADLNPIENLWALLSREVYGEMKTYDSAQALIAEIQAACGRVQENRLLRRNLVGNMPERLQAVLEAKGGPTKF